MNPQTRKRSGDDTVAARGLGALGTKCWAAGVNIAQCVGARQQITYHQSRARSCEGDIRSDNLDQAIAFGVFCGDGISGGVSHHFARRHRFVGSCVALARKIYWASEYSCNIIIIYSATNKLAILQRQRYS